MLSEGKVIRGKSEEGNPEIIEINEGLKVLLDRGSRRIWRLNVKVH